MYIYVPNWKAKQLLQLLIRVVLVRCENHMYNLYLSYEIMTGSLHTRRKEPVGIVNGWVTHYVSFLRRYFLQKKLSTYAFWGRGARSGVICSGKLVGTVISAVMFIFRANGQAD